MLRDRLSTLLPFLGGNLGSFLLIDRRTKKTPFLLWQGTLRPQFLMSKTKLLPCTEFFSFFFFPVSPFWLLSLTVGGWLIHFGGELVLPSIILWFVWKKNHRTKITWSFFSWQHDQQHVLDPKWTFAVSYWVVSRDLPQEFTKATFKLKGS